MEAISESGDQRLGDTDFGGDVGGGGQTVLNELKDFAFVTDFGARQRDCSVGLGFESPGADPFGFRDEPGFFLKGRGELGSGVFRVVVGFGDFDNPGGGVFTFGGAAHA